MTEVTRATFKYHTWSHLLSSHFHPKLATRLCITRPGLSCHGPSLSGWCVTVWAGTFLEPWLNLMHNICHVSEEEEDRSYRKLLFWNLNLICKVSVRKADDIWHRHFPWIVLKIFTKKYYILKYVAFKRLEMESNEVLKFYVDCTLYVANILVNIFILRQICQKMDC